jgi:SAM-dependent methyltransferase
MLPDFDVVGYWETRYLNGGDSGAGSRGDAAEWKADRVNHYAVGSVLDIGCGDGVQAALFRVIKYLGIEVSETAVLDARDYYPRKQFELSPPFSREWGFFDTHLSLDIIYHLVDDDLYADHLDYVFGAKKRAIVYSSNFDHSGDIHVLHRRWTNDVPAGWELVALEPGAHRYADLYVFDRIR